MYHEAMSIFLASKNVLNLVYFWVEYILGDKIPKSSIFLGLSKIPIEIPPGVYRATERGQEGHFAPGPQGLRAS